MSRLLVVDDDPQILSSFRRLFARDGHEVATAESGTEALVRLQSELPDVVLMDVRMTGPSGLEVLRSVKSLQPLIPVILMTAFGTTETAIEAMKRGAFEFVLKPFQISELKTIVEKAFAAGALMKSVVQGGAPAQPGETRIVGNSSRMYEVCKLIGQVAPSNVTVLIRGESGTGKELVARALHEHSPRAGGPFVAVNCSAIPETLLESELFGYEKGTFTGAAARRMGRFEQADGGTIFLDEIADMAPSTQAKILRVLQEQSFERLGGRETIRTNVRVLAATNRDLEEMVRGERFRRDLYYRLHVVTISLPPLREKKEDIPALTEYFLQRYAAELGKSGLRASPEALSRLSAHDWPGNVREVEHCLKQAAVLCQGSVILPEHLHLDSTIGPEGPSPLRKTAEALRALARLHLTASPGSAYGQMVEQVEKELLAEVFRQTGGNLARAAKILGISRPTLREKSLRYEIRRNGSGGESGEETGTA